MLDVLAGLRARRRELGAAGGRRRVRGGGGAGGAFFGAPLRIGLALNTPLDGADVDPVCIAAARDAAALLSSLGHDVEEVVPPWSELGLLPDFTRAFGPADLDDHGRRRTAGRAARSSESTSSR